MSLGVLALTAVFTAGCQTPFLAHWSEKQTLNGFAEAVAAEDAERTRALASSDFCSSALRGDDAFEEVKRVWPVTGKLEILSVTEVEKADRASPDIPEKLVTVKDERGWETDYRLIEDPEKGRWVVDEILITSEQRGIKVTKTVSEQIEFAMVIRDFAEAWRDGDRAARLAHATPACRTELETLPEAVLDHMADRMFPPKERTVSTEKSMDEDIAVVRLRQPTGHVTLQMKRLDGRWLVDDASYQGGNEDEGIPSLRRTAIAYAAATNFLKAYAAADLKKLKETSVGSFFKSTLNVAELGEVSLPEAQAAKKGSLRLIGETGELVIDAGPKTYKIALAQTNDEEDVTESTTFRVEDVTIYENNGEIKKHLAAALVAEPTAKLFTDALIERDLASVKALSTNDFAEQVWHHTSGEVMSRLPLDTFHSGERDLLSIVHKGTTTEVTMLQSGVAMTVVLHDESGRVKVDDVLMAVSDRPSSLKTTLSQYLPVARLTAALETGNLDGVREQCTSGFNRSIWAQLREMPAAAKQAASFLDAPLSSLQGSDTEATVHLGQKDQGGMVTMLKFDGRWKVSEITLITGAGSSERIALKETLRDQLANGKLYAGLDGAVPPQTAEASGGGIEQVGYEVSAVEMADAESDNRESRPVPLGDADTAKIETRLKPIPSPNPVPANSSDSPPPEPQQEQVETTENATPVEPASTSSQSPQPGSAKSPAAPFDAPLWKQ